MDWLKFWKYISVRTSGHLRRHWQCKANATSMHLWPPNDDKDESDNDDKDELWNGIRTKSWKKPSGHLRVQSQCTCDLPMAKSKNSFTIGPYKTLELLTKIWKMWKRNFGSELILKLSYWERIDGWLEFSFSPGNETIYSSLPLVVLSLRCFCFELETLAFVWVENGVLELK